MIPTIEFRYSGIYDKRFRSSPGILKMLEKQGRTYPSAKQIQNYIPKVRSLWEQESEKILKSIQSTTGLRWRRKEIICYVIGAGICFSDPLTLKYYKQKNRFVDTLTHELIHQIQSQNAEIYRKWAVHLMKKFPKENKMCRNHIFLDAVLYAVVQDIFSSRRANTIVKYDKEHLPPEYTRAWEIVEAEGYENIIKEFKRVIRK